MDKELYVEMSDDKGPDKSIIREKKNNTVLYSTKKPDMKNFFLLILLFVALIIVITIFSLLIYHQDKKIKNLSIELSSYNRKLTEYESKGQNFEKELKELKNNYIQKTDKITILNNSPQNEAESKENIKDNNLKKNEINEKKNIIIANYEVNNINEEIMLFNNDEIKLKPREYTILIDNKYANSTSKLKFDSEGKHKVIFIFHKILTTLKSFFQNCDYLTKVNLSQLKTQYISDMSGMFKNSKKLKKINLTNFDTSLVTDMKEMFFGVSSLESIDIKHFNTSLVKNMDLMFSHMKTLSGLDLSSFDTRQVESMKGTFSYMDSLRILDISNFYIKNETNIEGIFDGLSPKINIFFNIKNKQEKLVNLLQNL